MKGPLREGGIWSAVMMRTLGSRTLGREVALPASVSTRWVHRWHGSGGVGNGGGALDCRER